MFPKGKVAPPSNPAGPTAATTPTATDQIAPSASIPGYGKTSATNVPMVIRTTMPLEVLRHNISDEELTALETHKIEPDPDNNVFLTALGAAVALIPTVARDVHDMFFITPSTVNLFQIIDIVIFAAATAVAVVMYHIKKPTKNVTTTSLGDTIRQRTNLRYQVIDPGKDQ
jgi:hypothetical protein